MTSGPDSLVIDGSEGEGGGQILRSSLALSLITGKPFRLTKIRARRDRPGLQRQHLAAVLAAGRISNAEVNGDFVGSSDLSFTPGKVVPGEYTIDIGTAGSTTLVLQTLLPPLILAAEPSLIHLTGGTHNPGAPTFDFLARAFVPLLNRMGPKVEVTMHAPGFYPQGGGRISALITPAAKLLPLHLVERGPIVRRRVRAVVVGLAREIAEREVRTLVALLRWPESDFQIEEVSPHVSRGNYLAVELESSQLIEVFTSLGQRGIPAEVVARYLVTLLNGYLASDAAVGHYLADQLLLPMALAEAGSYLATELSQHTLTHAEIIHRFLDIEPDFTPLSNRTWRISIGP
jgi:RNA 3'-terminal phosphate cyclase (ATP)